MTQEFAAVPVDDQIRINRVIRRLERINPLPTRKLPGELQPGRILTRFFQAPIGGIPARNGSTLGHATCKLWTAEIGANDVATISETEDEIIVYNWATVVVCDEVDRYGTAEMTYFGLYLVTAEQCDPNQ